MKKVIRNIVGILSEKLIGIFPLRFLPLPHVMLEQYFRYKMRKNDFDTVRDHCIGLSQHPSVSDRIKKISSDYFCKISLDNRPDPLVMNNLKTEYQKKISESMDLLASGKNDKAVDLFREALEIIRIPVAAITSLVDAFRIIVEGSASSISGKECRSSKKIILSGMYWSGTGALYDFFREFRDVKPLRGEQRLWKESDYSLDWGLKNIEKLDDLNFRNYLIRLFLIALTGLAMPRNWQDVLAENIGMNSIKNDADGKYSSAVCEYINIITNLMENRILDYNSFLSRSVVFTDQVFNALSGDFNGSILPDNAVHIGDIEAYKFFSNAHLVCVFRDPRSNYAARYHENERFHRDPERFIEYYRETRENFVKKMSGFKDISDTVIEVQFEDFILSEEYRKELALKLGLDPAGWNRQKYFRQHISEKNVFNYRNFSDHKAIDLIASSLGEYCYGNN